MKNAIKIIGVVILLAAIAGGIFMMNRQSAVQDQNDQLIIQVDSLLAIKANLLEEIEGLQLSFAREESLTDSLSTVLAEVHQQIAQHNASAQQIKQQHTTEVNALKTEIGQLRQLRSETETFIAQLREENRALAVKNTALTETVTVMKTENDQLASKGLALQVSNKQLEASVAKLKAASVKASGFQVSVDKKSGKNTVAAKRAKSIYVSFDMNNVPVEHHGMHTLYLVITGESAIPLTVANPIRVRIATDDEDFEIEAQQEQKVKLAPNQRIEFTQHFDSRLQPGKYKATIYSEMGLLGSSSFVLS